MNTETLNTPNTSSKVLTFEPKMEAIKALGTEEQVRTWIDALESEKYTQVREYMCEPEKPNSACCLHVAAMEVDKVPWDSALPKYKPRDVVARTPASLSIPAPFATGIQGKALACVLVDGKDHDMGATAVELNDKYSLTFKEIAALLKGETLNLTRRQPAIEEFV